MSLMKITIYWCQPTPTSRMSLGHGYRRKKQEEFKNLFLLRCTKVLLKDCSLYFLLDKYLFEVNTFRTTYVDVLTLL